MLPTGVSASLSPSPVKVPPVIETVALDKLVLSKSETVIAGEIVVVLPWGKLSEGATEISVRGSCAMLIVVVAAVLRLNEPEPSLSTQVTVRVGLALPLLGFVPDEKVTLSSTVW